MTNSRNFVRLRKTVEKHKMPVAAGSVVVLATVLLTYALGAETTRIMVRTEGIPDFKNASILGNPGEKVLAGEQSLFSRQQKEILGNQKQLQEEITKLRGQMIGQIGQTPAASGPPSPEYAATSPVAEMGPPAPIPTPTVPTPVASPVSAQNQPTSIRLGPAPDQYDTTPVSQAAPSRHSLGLGGLGFSGVDKSHRGGKPGSNIVSFPVKSSGAVYLKQPSVVLPSGSYVKAKLLTGVEAPEGKTYPALLQLDYAYVIPNHKRLDLAGCFAIAKAQGDLSTERVQMQAVKLSCVSKKGGFFEREVNGFVADDTDNSFAVIGSVNSKQDRVAAMAFLSSIVSGVSKAIQQAQTTQQTTPLGGSQSIVTGDQAKYIAAGGAADAASQVTQWYLKQAENLLPTINVGSGQDVWVIMQDSVDLPKNYFAQNNEEGVGHASIYSYFTRILE